MTLILIQKAIQSSAKLEVSIRFKGEHKYASTEIPDKSTEVCAHHALGHRHSKQLHHIPPPCCPELLLSNTLQHT